MTPVAGDGESTISGDEPLARAVAEFQMRLCQYDWSGQSLSRRHILEVFLRLALVHGFSSVSLRMIAKEVGIKAPSIYAHFPEGRDEIVTDSLRWHFYKFGTAVIEAVTPTASADEAWSALVRVHLTRQLELPESNLWDLLIATDRMVHVLPADISAETGELVELYERLYRAAARQMGFDGVDSAIRIVMTLLEGAGRWCEPIDDPPQLPRSIKRADALTRELLKLA